MPTLKEWFVPHEGNTYHPHLLHTHRAVIYGGFFVALKVIVVAFVLLLPVEVFVMPDVLEEEAQTLYHLTNDVRANEGLQPLAVDARLVSSARHKAEDMATGAYFSHTSPDGTSLATWLQDVGYPYRAAGENLAIGYSDPRALVSAWVQSPSHFANLIDQDFLETGIGVAAGEYEGVPVVYVAQHFGAEKTIQELQTVPEAHSTEETDVHITQALPEDDVPAVTVSSSTFGEVLGEKDTVTPSQSPASLEITDATPLDDPAHLADPVVEAEEDAVQESTADPIDYERSFVRYEVTGEESIRVTATVSLNTPYRSAKVIVPGGSILLDREDSYGVLSGSVDIDESEASYFRAVLLPELSVTLSDGTEMTSYIRWERIPQIGLTPIEEYTASKPFVHSFTHLFGITNAIYFFFIGLFSIALLVHIFWEVRVQHHHVTIQTLCLLLLLITLVAL